MNIATKMKFEDTSCPNDYWIVLMATSGDHWDSFWRAHWDTVLHINEYILLDFVMILLGKYYLSNSIITKFARIYIQYITCD